MYLVGGGTHPGSGLRSSLSPPASPRGLLLEDLGLEPQWHNDVSS